MNQNIFCSKCHRIPSQCCCSSANELADAIEKGGKDGFFQDEIVAILRKQQAEIEALKRHRNRLETLAEQMLQGDGNE
jgi:hypothetical protein